MTLLASSRSTMDKVDWITGDRLSKSRLLSTVKMISDRSKSRSSSSNSSATVRYLSLLTISRTSYMESRLIWFNSSRFFLAASYCSLSICFRANSVLRLIMAKVCPKVSCKSRPIRLRSFSADRILMVRFCSARASSIFLS